MDKKILVIEDELPLLNVIKIKLKDAGFTVFGVTNVDDAFKVLEKEGNVDLIWLDHYLPKKNGLEFVILLKQQQKTKDIPIFLVSNSTNLKDIYSYVNLGINKYYVKMDSSITDIISAVKLYFNNPGANNLTDKELIRRAGKSI